MGKGTSSKDFAQRFVGANMGFNFNPRNNDSFGQQWLEQSVIKPQETYNRSYQSGVNNAASRAGRNNGYAAGYQRFGVADSIATDSYIRGQESAIRRHYNNAGRYDMEDSLGSGGQSGGQRAPRFNDNGRFSNQRDYEDTHGRGTMMGRSQPAVAMPANDYAYVVSVDNKQYVIRNDAPLSPDQQQEIAGALRFIDKQHMGGNKRDEEVGALRHAFDNGLSPNAEIAVGNGRDKPLPQFVQDNMMGQREDAALAMIRDEQRKDYQERAQAAQQERETRSTQGSARGNSGNEFAIPQSEMVLTNIIRDAKTPKEANQALESVRRTLDGIDSHAEARQFHRELAANPQLASEYMALVQKSDLPDATKTREIEKFVDAQNRIAKLDPEGHAMAERAATSTKAYAQAHNVAANRLSTEDMAKLSIADPELEKRFRNAVNQQKNWDDMAKGNGLAGALMTLFRPLLEMLNPDSNPGAILAEAKEKNIGVNGPAEVLAKVDGHASGAAVAATAQSAEQGTGTSPGTTPAAQAPSPQQMTAGAPAGQEAKDMAAQGQAQAQRTDMLAAVNALPEDERLQVKAEISAVLHSQGGKVSEGNLITPQDIAAYNAALASGKVTLQGPGAAKVEEMLGAAGVAVNHDGVVSGNELRPAGAAGQSTANAQISEYIRKPDENAQAPAAPVTPDFMGDLLKGFKPPESLANNTATNVCDSTSGTLAAGSAPNLAAQQKGAACGV